MTTTGVRLDWMRLVGMPADRDCLMCRKPLPPMVVGDSVAAFVVDTELVGIV
jgi:hypothetical protein